MKSANLALRFLLELGALAALGYWGATVPGTIWLRIVLAIGIPALTAVVWGMFIAPRARIVIPEGWRHTLALLVFAAASLALFDRDELLLAVILAGLAALNAGLLLMWQQ